jgi:hypothetical protein
LYADLHFLFIFCIISLSDHPVKDNLTYYSKPHGVAAS